VKLGHRAKVGRESRARDIADFGFDPARRSAQVKAVAEALAIGEVISGVMAGKIRRRVSRDVPAAQIPRQQVLNRQSNPTADDGRDGDARELVGNSF
jgi:hypothetical protein